MKKDNHEYDFRENEIVRFSRWDTQENKWTTTVFPKISGRLRLAHKENEQLSIFTEILRNDESVAIVSAKTVTLKGSFNGIGMASAERDKDIAPAILELAETRAISRSLRFAGYGIEYCSAEEVSHLRNESSLTTGPEKHAKQRDMNPADSSKERVGNSKSGHFSKKENGYNERLTTKQLNYILNLGKSRGLDTRDLEKQSIAETGVRLGNLNKKEATMLIDLMRSTAK